MSMLPIIYLVVSILAILIIWGLTHLAMLIYGACLDLKADWDAGNWWIE